MGKDMPSPASAPQADLWIQRLIDEEGKNPSIEPFSLNESAAALAAEDLEAARSRFILQLRGPFLRLAREFNHLKKTGHFIYIYRLRGFEEGFMLYRRGFRLIFSPGPEGRIQMQALQAILGRAPKEIFNGALLPFRLSALSEFQWILRGVKGFVEPLAFARFYFKAFARLSRAPQAEASEEKAGKEEEANISSSSIASFL